MAFQGVANPSCRTDTEAWQDLVRSNPEKALSKWIDAEKRRSEKRVRYSDQFNLECVRGKYDWKVFLLNNCPDIECSLSDDEGDVIVPHPNAGPSRPGDQQPVLPSPMNGNKNVYLSLNLDKKSGGDKKRKARFDPSPGSPRDGNFCEPRLPWHVTCLPEQPQTFRKWAWTVAAREHAKSKSRDSNPIDVDDL